MSREPGAVLTVPRRAAPARTAPARRPPISGRAAWRRTHAVREDFLAAGDPDRLPPETCGVRREIVLSWRRSLLSGVDAGRGDIPLDEGHSPSSRLVDAAQLVLDRLAGQLAELRAWAFLTDRDCRLVARVAGDRALLPRLDARGAVPGALFAEDAVGTNGLGTAFEQQEPFIVVGSEHFREPETRVTTTGVPIRDHVSGRTVGLLNVNCYYEQTNTLLLPLATEHARSIEARLRAGHPPAEQALLEEFLRASRRSWRAVVALGAEVFIANAAARSLLDGADVELLRHWACDASAGGRERTAELPLRPDLTVTARCRPVPGQGRHPAAVVVLAPTLAPARAHRPRPSARERLLEQLAPPDTARTPLLLRGERGTGKTTLARALHDQTGPGGGERPEPGGPLTVIDAAASAAQAAEWFAQLRAALAAATGTVLLRHLDDLPPALVGPTASLLEPVTSPAPPSQPADPSQPEASQARPASPRARLIATASDRAGDRADLAALLERFPVVADISPLRERAEDVPALVAEIIAELRPQWPRPRCTPAALAVLTTNEWPGNVRQLRQAVATALTRSLAGDITTDDLPADLAAAGAARHLTKLERLERHALLTALRDAAWDRETAARDLGISRATIYRKLKTFGIRPPALHPRPQPGVGSR